MRTTIDLKEALVKKAQKLTDIQGKTALLHAGLEALIEKMSKQRLASLGGTDKKAVAPKRRR